MEYILVINMSNATFTWVLNPLQMYVVLKIEHSLTTEGCESTTFFLLFHSLNKLTEQPLSWPGTARHGLLYLHESNNKCYSRYLLHCWIKRFQLRWKKPGTNKAWMMRINALTAGFGLGVFVGECELGLFKIRHLLDEPSTHFSSTENIIRAPKNALISRTLRL